ncbi:MAG TPA: hypothetical protein VHC94_10355 [Nitrobacter sp.]|nr:hypothetical protein [Nitrobacter sp.]
MIETSVIERTTLTLLPLLRDCYPPAQPMRGGLSIRQMVIGSWISLDQARFKVGDSHYVASSYAASWPDLPRP